MAQRISKRQLCSLHAFILTLRKCVLRATINRWQGFNSQSKFGEQKLNCPWITSCGFLVRVGVSPVGVSALRQIQSWRRVLCKAVNVCNWANSFSRSRKCGHSFPVHFATGFVFCCFLFPFKFPSPIYNWVLFSLVQILKLQSPVSVQREHSYALSLSKGPLCTDIDLKVEVAHGGRRVASSVRSSSYSYGGGGGGRGRGGRGGGVSRRTDYRALVSGIHQHLGRTSRTTCDKLVMFAMLKYSVTAMLFFQDLDSTGDILYMVSSERVGAKVFKKEIK